MLLRALTAFIAVNLCVQIGIALRLLWKSAITGDLHNEEFWLLLIIHTFHFLLASVSLVLLYVGGETGKRGHGKWTRIVLLLQLIGLVTFPSAFLILITVVRVLI